MDQLVMPSGDPEQWLPIPGYEGRYEVSDLGRVRSVDRRDVDINFRPYRKRGRVLRPAPHRFGYLCVALWRNGRQDTRTIHALVAAAFLGPCPDGMEVCHGPGGMLDNRPANLSYGTRFKNQGPDRLRDGTANTGVRNGAAKLNDEIVRECRARFEAGEAVAALAREFGVTHTAVLNAVRGVTWKHVA